jgi:hypothetical protein
VNGAPGDNVEPTVVTKTGRSEVLPTGEKVEGVGGSAVELGLCRMSNRLSNIRGFLSDDEEHSHFGHPRLSKTKLHPTSHCVDGVTPQSSGGVQSHSAQPSALVTRLHDGWQVVIVSQSGLAVEVESSCA